MNKQDYAATCTKIKSVFIKGWRNIFYHQNVINVFNLLKCFLKLNRIFCTGKWQFNLCWYGTKSQAMHTTHGSDQISRNCKMHYEYASKQLF